MGLNPKQLVFLKEGIWVQGQIHAQRGGDVKMEGDSRLQAKESLRPPEAGKEAWGAVIRQSLQRKLNLP